MKILITVCARGGSKGIVGKNIKTLNGRPLIYYTLKLAEKFASIYSSTEIFLSTDSIQIKEVVKDLSFSNVRTDYVRPAFLATDSAGKLDVIKDAVNHASSIYNTTFDFIIDLDVTSPLRTIQDLSNALDKLIQKDDAVNIFSVSQATKNPYFNMVELDNGGFAKLCKEGSFLARQSAPIVFELNASFYIYKSKFFDNNYKSVITSKSLTYEVNHLCFDLDNQVEFEFMSYLLERKKLDFKLIE